MKKNPFTHALTELIIICSPIVILLSVLFLDGNQDLIFKKPEWSFLSIILLVEVMRDIGAVAKKSTQDELIEVAYSFYSILIVLTAIVLIMDFQYSSGTGHVPASVVYILKFSWFIFCVVTFLYKRYQRHKI